MLPLPFLLGLLARAAARPQASGTATAPIDTSVPSITLSTTVAAPTVPLSNPLPAQVALPPVQPWCPSKIFCAGELIQTVNIASLYADPKTFVDKPTSQSSQQVLANFNTLLAQAGNATTNLTEQQLVTFVDDNFRGEGLELEALALPNFNPAPAFLANVSDPLIRAWSQTVHGFWTQLIRGTNSSTLCGEGTNAGACESTLIPLNHTFVVPGGRFREQYYWDSYWITQGLIQSELLDVVNDTLQNFMDELDKIGFVPNGGRIYYLDRSQPPLFINMLSDYVHASNDTAILTRALPLAERELLWWQTNRTINVTSPFTNKTYAVARYAVNNTAPRPESYLTDYTTVNAPGLPTLTDAEQADLYAELASGAETGWDYTVRFFKEPFAGGSNNTGPGLRTLNIRSTVPVDLNSILYRARLLLADLYSPPFATTRNTTAASRASFHRAQAADIRAAILDLFWEPSKLAFFDFNMTANARNDIFTAAHFYPLWGGIIPDEALTNETAAFGMFAALNFVLNRYNGTFPTTMIQSGQQWDAPNAWPPHQFIAIEALRNVPANLTTQALPLPGAGQTTFDLVPPGQLGLDESALPGQPLRAGGNATAGVDINTLNGTVVNGGNATEGENWSQTLQREMINRYFTSAFCSWHATGGSIPNVLPRLSDAELNVTLSANNTGNMFEKFSNLDVDSAGRGGEYTVQAGFGWTNGVVLWGASNFGGIIAAPTCPPLLVASSSSSGNGTGSGSGSSSGAPVLLPVPGVMLMCGLAFVILLMLA